MAGSRECTVGYRLQKQTVANEAREEGNKLVILSEDHQVLAEIVGL